MKNIILAYVLTIMIVDVPKWSPYFKNLFLLRISISYALTINILSSVFLEYVNCSICQLIYKSDLGVISMFHLQLTIFFKRFHLFSYSYFLTNSLSLPFRLLIVIHTYIWQKSTYVPLPTEYFCLLMLAPFRQQKSSKSVLNFI